MYPDSYEGSAVSVLKVPLMEVLASGPFVRSGSHSVAEYPGRSILQHPCVHFYNEFGWCYQSGRR